MSFGGFGLSPGDFVLLVQLARKTFRNCQQAGHEYAEIASEVRCLHSVLRTIRKLAERPGSRVFRQDLTTTAQLRTCADGCQQVLNDLDRILAKYETLNGEGQPSVTKKIWQRFRFGSKSDELGVVRGKLIMYTSTLSVLIDTIQTQAIDRVETKIEDGFGEVKGEFERIRKEIYSMASQARAAGRNGSSLSLLSLSTYAGDEKEVWRAFQRELIMKGFRTQSLHKYRDVLQAYMLKLDRSGLLENPRSHKSIEGDRPWWSNRIFTETSGSLPDLLLGENAEDRSDIAENEPPPGVTFAPCLPQVVTEKWAPAVKTDRCRETAEEFSPMAQDIPGRSTHVSAQEKVVFVPNSTNRKLRHGTGKATRSFRSVLRKPTPAFPEDPNFFREGISPRKDIWGGQVPKDARITLLDKSSFDINSLLWIMPSCEDRGDHLVVFKVLDMTEIRIFMKLTAFIREYPDFEISLVFDLLGEYSKAAKFNFLVYALYIEHYPHQSRPSSQVYYSNSVEMLARLEEVQFWEYWDAILDLRIEKFIQTPQTRNRARKFCDGLEGLLEEESKALDEHLLSLMPDWLLLKMREWGWPIAPAFEIQVRKEIAELPGHPSRGIKGDNLLSLFQAFELGSNFS